MSITVIMAVYAKENAFFLNQALESIWDNQTLKPNEIILIEDGPLTVELQDSIKHWKEKLKEKFIIIKNSTNLGLTKSLNIGISHVHSELIARMDSDDISHPDRFQKQVQFLKENPDIAIVGGSLQEFNKNESCLKIRKYPKTPTECKNYIYKASPLAHPAVMMRKKIFEAGLKYNEKYRTSQDIALWFDAISNGFQIANLPDILLYFRREDSVFQRRSRKKAINEFKIYINGIYKLKGVFTLKYIFPIIRFLFRLMPQNLIKWGYNSKLRTKFLQS